MDTNEDEAQTITKRENIGNTSRHKLWKEILRQTNGKAITI